MAYAIESGNLELVKYLSKRNDLRMPLSDISLAARNGNLEMVKYFKITTSI